ncbi:hypothetical protein NMY22_g5434 [Coprinellus aureogranulatus]|nr:hypothetical protein NMY22_g5434 [Coprinellus aureogranulatus]
MLLKILKKVAEQCHEIKLERSAHITGLVTGGFDQLQRSLGENKVSLSIVEAKLTVRGTTEDLAVAKAVVSDLASSAPSAPSEPASTQLCPFCKRVPVSPVKLTCRHAYCQACLQFALASTALKRDAIPRSPFFACVAPLRSRGKPQGGTASDDSDNVVTRCNAPLSYFVVRDNLPFSHDSHYLKAVFATSVRASQGRFFFCPTPDCSAVYRSGDEGIVIRCQGCSSDVCPKCSKRAHDGSLCLVE